MSTELPEFEALKINEVQLLLAEKRTSLAILRTGLAVLALPMSITTFLIATSKYYEWINVWHFLLPIIIINIILLALGAYLITHSIKKLLHYDKLIQKLTVNNQLLKQLVD
ncbi:MAG: hypothetical protein E6Q83_12820 [Thiothrix sp.]|nr:MAG: hypothetical protein E6Q83_12820 [Thiothrix sp.]